MKVIIPIVDNIVSKNHIADSFHNSEFACIYNEENESFEWVNTKNLIKGSNLGDELKNKEISAVICKNMPLMALGFFTDSGIVVYQARNAGVEENIRLFTRKLLEPFTNAIVKSQSACSGSCGSCHTTCSS